MKKSISIILCLIIIASVFAGCGSSQNKNADIVCTIFPIYDWVKNILGDDSGLTVSFLLDDGIDLHNYQASASDITVINNSKAFFCIGGESDEWVDDVKNEDSSTLLVKLMDNISGLSVEEEVEGMQTDDEEEGEEEYDEHIWLSVNKAEFCCDVIISTLKSIDPDNYDKYEDNYENYIVELNSLNERYKAVTSGATSDTLIFADRFPFRYLMDDYGLNYYAAFSGCSAESEASFETVKFLADKVDELDSKYVIILEGSDTDIAETIISNSGKSDVEILTLNSIQTITLKDVQNGASYINIMSENLDVLETALH